MHTPIFIPRALEKIINKELKAGRVVVIYGARQVGKTTLLRTLLSNLKEKALFVNADLASEQEWLRSLDLSVYRRYLAGVNLLVIDEAQRVQNIGLALKIIVDNLPHLKVLVSGSSSFELANKINEPLTGRKIVFRLFPVSVKELVTIYSLREIEQILSELLIYGQYPKVLTLQNIQEKEDYLYDVTESYLFKDVLALTNIRRSDTLYKLVQLIAFQIGNEVSASELSNNLDIDKKTVLRYLDLLEKSFVIYSLPAYSTNKRKEISKSRKYYFYDLGLRNAIIRDFRPFDRRNDIGALWENFILNERIKLANYSRLHKNFYFWRSYSGTEIDLVEEYAGKLICFEIKFNPKKQVKEPALWKSMYSNYDFFVINRQNWLDWVVN